MLTTIFALTLMGAPTVAEIEAAHGAATLREHAAVKARIELDFGGKPRVYGTLYVSTDGGRTRIEFDSGRTIVFDGRTAWSSSADAAGARFDALTWSYFMLAPFKLGDAGAFYRDVGPKPWLEGRSLPAAKLTFGEDVGDAPDDWYVVYADPDSHVLQGLAYIVTFGNRPKEKAEQEPHAIVYSDYASVQGVRLASKWSFRLWTEQKGSFGDELGRGELSKFELLEGVSDGTFERPEDAKEVSAP